MDNNKPELGVVAGKKPAPAKVAAPKAKGTAVKAAPANKAALATKATKTIISGKKVIVPKQSFFGDAFLPDILPNETKELAAMQRLRRIVYIETCTILALAAFLVVGQPLFESSYLYYALSPQKMVMRLAPLSMPNMTNHAVLAWAASSITELMTLGFGDFESKLISQRKRFTSEGWDAFVHAFLNAKFGETMKRNLLVLTTVPRDTPVIVSQGENERGVYQWVVQMPIIMTYATNNNVTKKDKSTVTLTIVRSNEGPTGVAIESWMIGG